MEQSPLLNNITQQLKRDLRTVILPEGDDQRTVDAVQMLAEQHVCQKIIVIAQNSMLAVRQAAQIHANGGTKIEVLDASDPALQSLTAQVISDVLTAKGRVLQPEHVAKISVSPLYQAGALLAKGRGDCAVAGAVANTADVIRAALTTVGLAPRVKTVSGGFLMERSLDGEHESLYFADSGVVIDPSVDQLVDIAKSSCDTWQKLTGVSPVVAFLSFSTRGSAAHPSVEKMAQAAAAFRLACPDIAADGELQFDAAYVPSVGERKAPGSTAAGKANVYIFPDLNAGNISYKIAQRLGGFHAYGPILQGLAKPYSDLSRGASARDIAVSALINLMRI